MSEEYLNRTPISDIDIDDLSLVETYKGKINENNFTDAVKILDNASFVKGIRASIVDKIRTSILALETAILNLTADDDIYYSLTVPTDEQMIGKKFWVCPKNVYYATFEKTDWSPKKDSDGNYIKDEYGNPKSFQVHITVNFPMITMGKPLCLLINEDTNRNKNNYFLTCIGDDGNLEESRRIFSYTYTYEWTEDGTSETKNMEDYIYDMAYGDILTTNLKTFPYTDEGKEKAMNYLLNA